MQHSLTYKDRFFLLVSTKNIIFVIYSDIPNKLH